MLRSRIVSLIGFVEKRIYDLLKLSIVALWAECKARDLLIRRLPLESNLPVNYYGRHSFHSIPFCLVRCDATFNNITAAGCDGIPRTRLHSEVDASLCAD